MNNQQSILGWIISLFVKLIIVIVVFAMGFGIGFLVSDSGKNKDKTNQSDNPPVSIGQSSSSSSKSSSSSSSGTNSSADLNKPSGAKVIITSPKPNDKINGLVKVEGTVDKTNVQFAIRLLDIDGSLLAEEKVTLDKSLKLDANGVIAWKTNLSLSQSPEKMIAAIKVVELVPTPNSQPEVELAEVPANFTTLSDARALKVKIEAPQANQLVSSGKILFRGEMFGFFEGQMDVRLVDQSGKEIFRGSIQGEVDSTSGEFIPFEKELDVGKISPAAGTIGKFQIFEESAKDGSETILVEIPVRFVE